MKNLSFPVWIAGCLAVLAGLTACEQNMADDSPKTTKSGNSKASGKETANVVLPAEIREKGKTLEVITLGAGCFWCIEAVLEQIDGIEDVESGYMGGKVLNPTYRQVCTGRTGHAEVVLVKFDPKKITLSKVLDNFWELHDPTTLNRQGADTGTQYRSAIFYHSDAQKNTAEESKKAAASDFRNPIVTEITAAGVFYPAELEHQDFYVNNKNNGYCRAVISPKLKKLGLKR